MSPTKQTTFILVIILTLATLGCSSEDPIVLNTRLSRFEASLSRIQRDLKIPGMAAVILEDQQVRWARGFGYADVERMIPATPETPFQLCSVTKPIAGMIIHRMVERGDLDLETPLIDYGIDYDSAGAVRLIHLFSHTSQGIPGFQFRYHGDRYGTLGTAIKKQTGRSLRTRLIEEVLEPLGMTNTAPNPADGELLERFMNYRKERNLDVSVRHDTGEDWITGDLFDYDDTLFDRSINLSMTLLADYFDSMDIKRGRFFRYIQGSTDDRTKREFAEFYDQDNQFMDIYASLATPYQCDSALNMVPGQYSMFFSPAAGINASVLDMAKFDIAVDTNYFVSEATKRMAFTPVVTDNGDTSPYGLGWASQVYKDVQIIWHGGEWRCASALYLKVPEKNLTLILAANSRLMSQGFRMYLNDALESGIALEFLRMFVFEPSYGELGPDIDWAGPTDDYLNDLKGISNTDLRDIFVQQTNVMEYMYTVMQRFDVTPKIVRGARSTLMPNSLIGKYDDIPALAVIDSVPDNSDLTDTFRLDQDASVRVYTIGEITPTDSWDYGWIEDLSTGQVMWKPDWSLTVHAGGANRNRLVDTTIELTAGEYALRYTSDDSHSFMEWRGMAPRHLYWGIRLHLEMVND